MSLYVFQHIVYGYALTRIGPHYIFIVIFFTYNEQDLDPETRMG